MKGLVLLAIALVLVVAATGSAADMGAEVGSANDQHEETRAVSACPAVVKCNRLFYLGGRWSTARCTRDEHCWLRGGGRCCEGPDSQRCCVAMTTAEGAETQEAKEDERKEGHEEGHEEGNPKELEGHGEKEEAEAEAETEGGEKLEESEAGGEKTEKEVEGEGGHQAKEGPEQKSKRAVEDEDHEHEYENEEAEAEEGEVRELGPEELGELPAEVALEKRSWKHRRCRKCGRRWGGDDDWDYWWGWTTTTPAPGIGTAMFNTMLSLASPRLT